MRVDDSVSEQTQNIMYNCLNKTTHLDLGLGYVNSAKSCNRYALYEYGSNLALNCLIAAEDNLYKAAILFAYTEMCRRKNRFGECIVIQGIQENISYEEIRDEVKECL